MHICTQNQGFDTCSNSLTVSLRKCYFDYFLAPTRVLPAKVLTSAQLLYCFLYGSVHCDSFLASTRVLPDSSSKTKVLTAAQVLHCFLDGDAHVENLLAPTRVLPDSSSKTKVLTPAQLLYCFIFNIQKC